MLISDVRERIVYQTGVRVCVSGILYGQPVGDHRVALSDEVRAKGRARRIEQANARAADLGVTIKALQTEGITSLGKLAKALNERAIPTPSGRGRWHPAQVGRVLRRV